VSGYDEATGWTSFTETRWRRYFNRLPNDVEADHPMPIVFDRCRRAALDYYLGAANTLFVRCGPGRLWTLLSGLPSNTEDPAPPEEPATQWLSVTDIGVALTDPPLPTSSVKRLLRQVGFLQRIDGEDVPTDLGRGLLHERPAVRATAYAATWRPGIVQRVWSYAALEALRRMDWTAA
jgi:hypothetical protein